MGLRGASVWDTGPERDPAVAASGVSPSPACGRLWVKGTPHPGCFCPPAAGRQKSADVADSEGVDGKTSRKKRWGEVEEVIARDRTCADAGKCGCILRKRSVCRREGHGREERVGIRLSLGKGSTGYRQRQ